MPANMQTNPMARQALKNFLQHRDGPSAQSSELLPPPDPQELSVLVRWKKVELAAAAKDCLKALNYGNLQESTDTGSFECSVPHVDIIFALFPQMLNELKLDKLGNRLVVD